MPFGDMEPFFVQMVNYNYMQQRASYGNINARFRTDYKLNNPRYGMFAELQGATTFTSERKKSIQNEPYNGLYILNKLFSIQLK